MVLSVYKPPYGVQVRHTSCYLDGDRMPAPINLMQNDRGIYVLAVCLYHSGVPYVLPENARAEIHMEKPDRHYVVDPALGVNEARNILYFTVTPQMTAASGVCHATVEISSNLGVLGEGYIELNIQKNPVPEKVIRSTDEYQTLYGLITEAEAAVKETVRHAEDARFSADGAANSALAAVQSADQAEEAVRTAQEKASAASGSADAAAGSAQQAADSAAGASESEAAAAAASGTAKAEAEKSEVAARKAESAAGDVLNAQQHYAPALSRTVTGEVIAVDDVSPLVHMVGCRVSSPNLFGGEFEKFFPISIKPGIAIMASCDYFQTDKGWVIVSFYDEKRNTIDDFYLDQKHGNRWESVLIVLKKDVSFVKFRLFHSPKNEYQISTGNPLVGYVPHIADLSAVTVSRSALDGSQAETYNSDENGVITGMTSLSPGMKITTDNPGALLDVTYNQDAGKVIADSKKYKDAIVFKEIEITEPDVTVVDVNVPNCDAFAVTGVIATADYGQNQLVIWASDQADGTNMLFFTSALYSPNPTWPKGFWAVVKKDMGGMKSEMYAPYDGYYTSNAIMGTPPDYLWIHRNFDIRRIRIRQTDPFPIGTKFKIMIVEAGK